MASRLFVNALRSVGLVGEGDDPEAKVMLFKSRDTDETESMMAGSEPPASGRTTMKENAVLDLTGIEDEELRAAVSDRISKLEAQLAEHEPPEDDVVKAASPELQALIKAQEERITAAEQEVAKEREARLHREAVAKAEALPFIADTGQLTEVLKGNLDGLLPILEALNERLRDSSLFKQFGPANADDADPIERRDVFVTEYTKDNPGVSAAQARAVFWKTHPEFRAEARKDS